MNELVIQKKQGNGSGDDWLPLIAHDPNLVDAWQTMPGMVQEDVHWLIHWFEHPRSWLALPGAIDLFDHDCLHLLLCRGMHTQDEAFVIGLTMGNATAYRNLHGRWWKWIMCYGLPQRDKITHSDRKAFDLGVAFGRQLPYRNIHRFDFQSHLSTPVSELQKLFGIHRNTLIDFYKREQQAIPDSPTSKRIGLYIEQLEGLG